jgi:predicted restriction endonuclease
MFSIKEFKKKILELYYNKCIVTDNDCTEEVGSEHIFPVSEEEYYRLDNGLLLD